jgi:hypothetical protein
MFALQPWNSGRDLSALPLGTPFHTRAPGCAPDPRIDDQSKTWSFQLILKPKFIGMDLTVYVVEAKHLSLKDKQGSRRRCEIPPDHRKQCKLTIFCVL